MGETKKRCATCRKNLPLDKFGPDKRMKLGKKSACRNCLATQERSYKTKYVEEHSVPVYPRGYSKRKEDVTSQHLTDKTIVCIGDTHFPWHDQACLDDIYTIIESYQPDICVQLGDLYDYYSVGNRYPRSHNLILPRDEMEEGRKQAAWMWEKIRRLSPKTACYQIRGNHDDRPIKRILATMPEGEDWIVAGLRDLFTFDGVETVHNSRQELVIDGIFFMHGFRRFGEHCRWNQAPTVCGHSHRGGVVFHQNENRTIWELNAGCIVNADAPVFSYNSQKRMHGMVVGVGIIDRMGPRFVPLPL